MTDNGKPNKPVTADEDGNFIINWDALKLPDPLLEDIQNAEADDAANAEARGLAQGNLQQIAAQNQHARDEGLKDELWWMVKWGLRVAFGIIMVAALLWCWHLLLPESWGFLTGDQISKIENFGAGGITAALMNLARKNMPGSK